MLRVLKAVLIGVLKRFLTGKPANSYEEIAFLAIRQTALNFGKAVG